MLPVETEKGTMYIRPESVVAVVPHEQLAGYSVVIAVGIPPLAVPMSAKRFSLLLDGEGLPDDDGGGTSLKVAG